MDFLIQSRPSKPEKSKLSRATEVIPEREKKRLITAEECGVATKR